VTDEQLYRQLESLVLAETWPGTANRVFPSGSVLTAPALEEKALRLLRPPWVLFRVGSADVDPEHNEESDLSLQTVEAVLAVRIPGGQLGRGAILGKNRQAGESKGAGILQVQARLLSAIRRLGPQNGISIGHVYKGAVGVKKIRDRDFELQRGYRFGAWVTADSTFPGATRFTATGGVGSATLAWALPGDRYDFVSVHVRRAVGAVPPATVADGVSAYQGVGVGFVDALAANTYSYSLFAEYDADEDGAVDSYSDPPEKQASVVVA